MRASVVDKDDLGGRSGEVINDLGQGQRALGGRGEGVGDIVQIDGRVIVVVESLAAGRNVGKAQLGRRLAGSQRLKLGEEALANAAGAYGSRSPLAMGVIEDQVKLTNDGNEDLVRSRHCDPCVVGFVTL